MAKDRPDNYYQKKILTIPNLLSLFRLLLIPVFVWVYFKTGNMPLTTALLVLSGLTDLVDGWVARHFHMISDLGKMLDPVADKLTQIAMLICLLDRFPHMMIPLILLLVKEVFAAITGLLAIHSTKVVMGAVWHGKATTAALYSMMILHLLWYQIPSVVSDILIGICVAIMTLSFILYSIKNIRLIQSGKKKVAS